MPAAIPLVAAAAGWAASSALAGAIGATVLGSTLLAEGLAHLGGFIVSSAINAIGGSLTKKKKSPSLSQDAVSVQDTVRSSVESHKIIYGQTRVSGVVVFDGATSTGLDNRGNSVSGDNVFRHFVIALAGHEVEEVGTIYLENSAVTLDAAGFVNESPYIRSSTDESQTNATINSVAAITGGVSITTSAAHTFTAGETVYLTYSNAYRGYTIATTPTPTSFTISGTFNVSQIQTGSSYPAYVKRTVDATTKYVRVKTFLGTADQAASPDLINEISDWTSDHRLRGIPYLYVRIQQAAEFSMNIENISSVVKGKKVYDPRSTLTEWSDNAALCQRDYFTSRDGSTLDEPYGFGCDVDEINDTYWIAAANICDEAVTKQDGSTQKRYTCNGVLDTATGLFDNLQSLQTASVGTVTYVQGQFRGYAAAYDSPSGTITENMLAGAVNSQGRPSRKDLFNAVRGTFVDPTQNYVVTDFPIVTNSTYEAQDGGDQLPKDIELPFTNDTEAAQRIGKLILDTSRQGIIATMPLNHSALQFAVNDTVYVNNTRRGWVNKIFRIKKFSLGVPGPFTATLQEEASASYDWNSGLAIVSDPAPDTNLPDPYTVSAPGVPSVAESLYQTRGSAGVKAVATMTWAASTDRYTRWYVPEYRRVENLAWTVLPQTGDTSVDIFDIAPGTYEFRVKTINHIGAASDYATGNPLEIQGLGARPSNVSNFTVQTLQNHIRLAWDAPTATADLDVIYGGCILIRHSELTSGATWEGSTSIGNEIIAANANGVLLPCKAGTYLAKFQDSTGQTSLTAATATTKSVSLVALSDIVTVSADPTFTGIHSNTFPDTSTLRLTGATLIDDITDFDSIPSFDYTGGVNTSGTFTFNTYYDLTTVQSIRLQSQIQMTTLNILDKIDGRSGLMDDWLDFDGTAGGGSVDCWVEVKTTDDDPAGTPTWTPWNRIDVADLNCRAFWPRAQLRSTDTAYTPVVSTLNVTARH